jgi:uncharacterized protein YjbI with pentapeptide repeats
MALVNHWSRATQAFHHLSQLGSTVKEHALPVWKSAMVHFARGRQWLMPNRRMVFWAAGISIAGALLIGFVIEGGPSWYGKHHAAIAPLLTLAAGVAVAGVALVRHFAQTEADRQRRITESFSKAVEQLGSDKLEVRLGGIYSLERISKESPDDYWMVMENLTAVVRERSRRNEAARTSQDFEQRVSQRAYFLWRDAGWPDGRDQEFWTNAVEQDQFGEPPATDVAAVLTVIRRRCERSRNRESAHAWRLDLSGAILKQAVLAGAHLERAALWGAHLERANLLGAYLEGADLWGAYLERADLTGAHLEGAVLAGAHLERAALWSAYLEGTDLTGAHLEGATLGGASLQWAHLRGAHLERAVLVGAYLERADLGGAHLEGADLGGAHLEGADLTGAYLEGADLTGAYLEGADLTGAYLERAVMVDTMGLSETELLINAHDDAATKLPAGLARPAL